MRQYENHLIQTTYNNKKNIHLTPFKKEVLDFVVKICKVLDESWQQRDRKTGKDYTLRWRSLTPRAVAVAMQCSQGRCK